MHLKCRLGNGGHLVQRRWIQVEIELCQKWVRYGTEFRWTSLCNSFVDNKRVISDIFRDYKNQRFCHMKIYNTVQLISNSDRATPLDASSSKFLTDVWNCSRLGIVTLGHIILTNNVNQSKIKAALGCRQLIAYSNHGCTTWCMSLLIQIVVETHVDGDGSFVSWYFQLYDDFQCWPSIWYESI